MESFDGRGTAQGSVAARLLPSPPLPPSLAFISDALISLAHVYKAAVLEHDPKKLEDLVQCAFSAIYEHLRARGDITAESEALSAALRALEPLRESKRDQCRPPHEVWLSSRSPMPCSPPVLAICCITANFALNRRCLDAVLETIKSFRVEIGHAFPCTRL